MVYAIVILFLVIILLVVEKQIISRSVNGLQLRVHINGTRGKSSVTRYIASGLSVIDNSVMAKVTGVDASIILSGKAHVLARTGLARVQEQFNVIRQASSQGIEKLILECMTISPDLQKLESRVFKPHIYVITNIKDDHREDMGISLMEQAESICNAIPESCTVVTNELTFLDLIKEKATNTGSTVIVPEISETLNKANLPHGVFAENLAMALTVCNLAGADSKASFEAMLKSAKLEDSPYRKVKLGLGELNFLNAFAVNDVSSTESFIKYWREKLDTYQKYSIILNTRSERPLRTDHLIDWIVDKSSEIDKVIVTGTHGDRAIRKLRKSAIDNNRIKLLRKNDLANLKEIITGFVAEGSLLIGIGNIGAYGNLIMEELS